MSAGADRTLILLRHGKSDYPGGVADHDRPLANRGKREAALAGDEIRARYPDVAQVLCSTAIRARETLQATGIGAPVSFSDEIYDASVGDILARIAALDTDPALLLVVGHAPGIPSTALTLADPDSDVDALETARIRFPTSAFAVLTVHGEWADLAADGATLRELVIPRA